MTNNNVAYTEKILGAAIDMFVKCGIEEKAYDQALTQLSGPTPVGFDAAFADRRGDVLALQGKKPEAVAEYQRAYKAFDERVEYRRLVEVKLNALGAQVPQQVAVSTAQSGGVQ